MEKCKKCVFFSGDHCKRNFNHYSDICYLSMEIFCCGCKYYDNRQKDRFCVNPEQGFLKGDYFCKTFTKQY